MHLRIEAVPKLADDYEYKLASRQNLPRFACTFHLHKSVVTPRRLLHGRISVSDAPFDKLARCFFCRSSFRGRMLLNSITSLNGRFDQVQGRFPPLGR